MNTNYPKQHTMTLNGRKIRLSGAKKSKAYQNRQDLWMKAHYGDIGIVNIISYKAGWLSEINNDTRKHANQGNKMRTYRLFKTIDDYKCEDYLHQVTNTRHRIALTKLRLSNYKPNQAQRRDVIRDRSRNLQKEPAQFVKQEWRTNTIF